MCDRKPGSRSTPWEDTWEKEGILQLEKRMVMDDMGTWGGNKRWLEGVLLASMEPCWGFCG